MTDYRQEFDQLVEEHNRWSASLEKPKNWFRPFMDGLALIVGPSIGKIVEPPLYSVKNLTPEQRNAIDRASELKRSNDSSDITNLYNYYRNAYITAIQE
jgi:poly-gamma-glutamate capsule biosynthesis protein CapA/YwtB (metallophosphatase superfamily)